MCGLLATAMSRRQRRRSALYVQTSALTSACTPAAPRRAALRAATHGQADITQQDRVQPVLEHVDARGKDSIDGLFSDSR